MGAKSATCVRNQLISKTDIVIFKAILHRLQSFDFNHFTIIVKEMSCSRAYRFLFAFFSFLRTTMREKTNPWFSNTTKILAVTLISMNYQYFIYFRCLFTYFLKLNARFTLHCLQQHRFSYFSYSHTYAYEWEKKGLKLIICLFHGLLNPNNGTMTSTENSNRVDSTMQLVGVRSTWTTFCIIFVTQNIRWKNDLEVLYEPLWYKIIR